jgi:hypothetical protein
MIVHDRSNVNDHDMSPKTGRHGSSDRSRGNLHQNDRTFDLHSRLSALTLGRHGELHFSLPASPLDAAAMAGAPGVL